MAEITSFYENEFATNWEHSYQQSDSRLKNTVTSATFDGRAKWFNELDDGEMTEVTERKGTTPDGDSTGFKYWIFRRKFQFIRTWDEDDAVQLGKIILPQSDEIRSATMAENRKVDDLIIEAFDATRYIGDQGTTSDAFDSNQSIAVNYVYSGSAADSGLTLAKLRKINALFDAAEVPDGERYIAYGAQQLNDSLGITELTSRDYSDMQALKDGKISYFMGLNWVKSQRLSVASNVRKCFAWSKGAMKFADLQRNVHIDVLPTKSHATQLRCVKRMGATRAKNTGVVRVYCDEAL